MTVTLMGGDMQAQGHAQLLVNILDLGANVQAAADMARFRDSQIPDVLSLEAPLCELVGAKLRRMVRPEGGAPLDEYGSSIAERRVLRERVACHGRLACRFHQRHAGSAKSGPRESGTVHRWVTLQAIDERIEGGN